MVRSHIDSGWSAATQVHPVRYLLQDGVNTVRYLLSNGVKAVSPEIFIVAMGQGLLCPEASIVAGVRRRVCNGVPGPKIRDPLEGAGSQLSRAEEVRAIP